MPILLLPASTMFLNLAFSWFYSTGEQGHGRITASLSEIQVTLLEVERPCCGVTVPCPTPESARNVRGKG